MEIMSEVMFFLRNQESIRIKEPGVEVSVANIRGSKSRWVSSN